MTVIFTDWQGFIIHLALCQGAELSAVKLDKKAGTKHLNVP